MPEFSTTVIRLFNRATATEQGGLLSGKDPTAFNPADPLRLWIVQVGIIVCTASLLSLALRKIRQPKVIAEVLGGILLGPTALGRIPGFTQHIFPQESRPYLSLVANIGLCLFLFLVGLEIDASIIKRNARLSATVAFAGMALPFALGAGLSVPLYNRFVDHSVQFTHFMLFTGVAYSITAFPVLCRILTELKLLDTTVGIVVLSAGVGNDIIGWTLLALSVALVNAGSGLTAIWILLTCVGWTLFLLFPIKYAFKWLAKKTGSIENGPSVFFMTITMMTLFGSAFFTDIIGVHAIFGAFIAGLVVPREGGLTIALTEKLEDMVAIIFLPLYFTLSGLSTDLGTLNDGITWGFTLAIISLAFTGKFGGCTLAARYAAKFNWRESLTIGSLMSCKGLVELIVLNVGLQAGILSTRVFSMFVLEALVLTFMTTPLVTTFYPLQHRVRIPKPGEGGGPNFSNVADDEVAALARAQQQAASGNGGGKKKRRFGRNKAKKEQGVDEKRGSEGELAPYEEEEEEEEKTRFTVVLDKIEHLPGAMAIAQLINPLVVGFDDEDELGVLDGVSVVIEGATGPTAAAAVAVDEPEGEKEDRLSEKLSMKRKDPTTGQQSPTHSKNSPPSLTSSSSSSSSPSTPITINALRLIQLTDRVSAVMKSHTTTLLQTDPLLSIFRMFALLQGIPVQSDVDVIAQEDMVDWVLERSGGFGAEMVVVPWVLHHSPSSHSFAGDGGLGWWQQQPQSQVQTPKIGGGGDRVSNNPFDALFKVARVGGGGGGGSSLPTSPATTTHHGHGHGSWTITQSPSVAHSHFIRTLFARSDVDVGLYIDQSTLLGNSSGSTSQHTFDIMGKGGGGRGRIHIFLPFFGGPDDRLALEFVVGLCRRNERLRATVVRFKKVEASIPGGGTIPGVEGGSGNDGGEGEKGKAQGDRNEEINTTTVASNAAGFPDTVYGYTGTEIRMQSETADNIIWARYAGSPPSLPPRSTTRTRAARSSTASSSSSAQDEAVIRTTAPRITFKEVASAKPLHLALDEAYAIQQQQHSNRTRKTHKSPSSPAAAASAVVVVTGRSRRLAVESHRAELKELMLEDNQHHSGAAGVPSSSGSGSGHGEVTESGIMKEVTKTLGEVGSAFVGRGVGVGVWILQATLDGER